MKSRTSLFNPAAFKKNITRFAPAWVLYTVFLMMVLTVVMVDNSEYYRAAGLADSLAFMVFFNMCYGFLNGQLLLGDLFNARHCNALHAMPLRRECWFVTHTVSGLLFALVPNALMALVALPMLGTGWQTAFWWLLVVNLQYLFFFGLAVLAALCVGNRFAMLLVYGITNFFALIVYWFFITMYQPLLTGVFVSEEPFLLFCPMAKMIEHYELIEVQRLVSDNTNLVFNTVRSVRLGEGWGYLAICACLGAAFIGLALLLYRRRKLESAGDFMAVRALEPVFLVLYTLSMAAFFQAFGDLFSSNAYVFLALGLVVGFFTGRMLLMRTTKVFQVKGFLWFGVLAAGFILSLVLTWLDPLGVASYIPETGEIRAVRVTTHYNPQFSDDPLMTEEADIEIARQIHQLVLDGKTTEVSDDDHVSYGNVCLYYELDNGATVIRRYHQVAASSPAGQLACTLYTRPEYIFGTDDVDAIVGQLERVYFDQNKAGGNTSGEVHMNYTNRDYLRGLTEAILADCAEGTMAQGTSYHPDDEQYAWVEFCMMRYEHNDTWYEYHNITIYSSNRHTVAYLEENPFPTEEAYG